MRVLLGLESDEEAEDPGTIEESLGTMEDVILHSKCQEHRNLISRSLGKYFTNGQDTSLEIRRIWGYRGVELRAYKNRLVTLASTSLDLVHSAKDPPGAVGSNRLNHQWIDRQLPKVWKRACEGHHGSECSRYWNSIQFLSHRPKLLIDTKNQCLVEAGPSSLPYVALSYVWGQGDFLKTLCSNLSKLKEHGALARTQPDNGPISTTIQSAMRVVELLEERYLWADALCIVQDDEIFKDSEIQKMHAIYANASLTIIAASSASCGIAGIRGSTEPRLLRQVVHTFETRQVVEISDGLDVPGSQSEESRWGSRGWTFQENLFSSRKLIFTRDSIRWECERATWIEDQATTREESIKNELELPTMLQLRVPDVKSLVALLNDYAARSLTFEEDALFACAGVFSPLQASYYGGFVSGLPRAFFNSALLWVHEGPSTRRTPRSTDHTKICLPSWSWAGWKGQFSLRNWEVGNDHLKGSPSGRMRPSHPYLFRSNIQWNSHQSPTAKPEKIVCSWLQSRDDHPWSTDTPLPPGWKRVDIGADHKWSDMEYSGPIRSSNTDIPKWCFTHESEPETEFWYPLHIPELGEHDTLTESLPPFISCRTRRGYATCGSSEQRRIYGPYEGDVPFCSLVNDDGEWIGALEVHDHMALADPSDPNSHSLFGNVFELVELGEGGCQDGFPFGCPALPEYDLPARPKTGFYEFYFVLWIEWISNIAYRRGLGRVMKAAWEAQGLDDIDLMLG